MNEQREKFVDEVLDKALAGYGQAAPRQGLEARVLARLEEAKAAPARMWWKWAWVPAAAALVVAGALYLARTRTQAPAKEAAQPNPPVTTTARTMPPPIVPTAPVRAHARRHAPASKAVAAAAKQPQFPAAARLTQQDRLLLALVRQHPQEAAQQARAGAQPLTEIKIEPLDIPPLKPDGDDQQAPQQH